MNTENMTVKYERDSLTRRDAGGKITEHEPGVSIRVDFIPGHHLAAEEALDRAVAHVKGRLVDPGKADDVG